MNTSLFTRATAKEPVNVFLNADELTVKVFGSNPSGNGLVAAGSTLNANHFVATLWSKLSMSPLTSGGEGAVRLTKLIVNFRLVVASAKKAELAGLVLSRTVVRSQPRM